MDDGIGRTAYGGMDGHGIFKGLQRHYVTGPDIFGDQIHNPAPRLLGQPDKRGMHRATGAVGRQRHAQSLGQTAHGIGCAHCTTSSAGWTHLILNLSKILIGNLSTLPQRVLLINELGFNGFPPITAREHIAAGDHYRRQIDPGQGHKLGRDDLIAGGDGHDAVHTLGLNHHLYGCRDDVPARKDPVHTHGPVGQSVTCPDMVKLNGHTACLPDADFNGFTDGAQVIVAGDEFVPGVCNGNKGAVEILIIKMHGFEESPPLIEGIFGDLPAVQAANIKSSGHG